jgi:hypothetical protein
MGIAMQRDKMPLTPEQAEMEAALAGLMPASPGINRDALMFAAGEAAGRAVAPVQTVWPWKIAACLGFGFGLISLGMAMHGTQPGVVPVVADAPATFVKPESVPEGAERVNPTTLLTVAMSAFDSGATTNDSPWTYHNLLSDVLNRGLDAMPSAPNGDASPNHAMRADEGTVRPQHILFFQGGRS